MKRIWVCLIVLCLFIMPAFSNGQNDSEDGPVTLKILTDMNPDDDMNVDPVTALTEELTGFNLVFDKLPDDPTQRTQKLNLLLAAGDDYDLIRLSSIGVAKELIPKGFFYELDDLLAEFGTNILANTSKEWFEPVTLDGKTYAVPIKRTQAASIAGSMYRKDIFDKYNLSQPTTPQEFKDALIVIRDGEGYTPFTGASGFPVIDTVSSAFGICNNAWYDVNGQLVPRVKMPGFVDYLTFMSDLTKEGLFDPEFAANTDQMVQTKVASGRVAVSFWAWWWWSANGAVRQNDGAEMAYMKPLLSDEGEGIAWLWGTTPEWATVIPKSSKKPEEAIKFLDALSDKDTFTKIFLGEEGVHYNKEDGMLMATPQYTAEKGNSWIMLMTSNDNLQLAYQQIGQSGEDENQDVLRTYQGMKDAADSVAVADPTVSLPPPEINGTYGASLGSLERDFILSVISGVKDISEYDAFIKQWNKEGGTELVDAWNNIYSSSK